MIAYELNGEDSSPLAAVGTFRVVPEQDLDAAYGIIHHLRDEGLGAAVDLGGDERGVVLTKEGRDLAEETREETPRDGGRDPPYHP